jgi:hypothetical protein
LFYLLPIPTFLLTLFRSFFLWSLLSLLYFMLLSFPFSFISCYLSYLLTFLHSAVPQFLLILLRSFYLSFLLSL